MRKLIIPGDYFSLLRRLFKISAAGHIEFGPAISIEPADSGERLDKGFVFRDYIMEGFVRYSLRAVRVDAGVELVVGLTGTNRDEYVTPSIRAYVSGAGVQLEPTPGASAP